MVMHALRTSAKKCSSSGRVVAGGARNGRRSQRATRGARRAASGRGSGLTCQAKYGDDSVFFDLDDLENTTGTWDRYGSDDPKRYPDQQAEFFERAAEPLARREIMFTFLGVAGALTAAAYGAVGAKDAKLPITVGPQKPPVMGPRDRL